MGGNANFKQMYKEQTGRTKFKMRKFLFTLIVLSSYSNNLMIAQVIFQKSLSILYGSSAWGVDQTSDGGYIITGMNQIPNSNNDNDIVLIKTDSVGDTLWTKTFGGLEDDRGYSIKETSDGGFIISGLTLNAGAFLIESYLIKTNSVGDTLWTKRYSTTNDFIAYSVEQTTDGGFIIGADLHATGGVSLLRTDSIGNILWSKGYGGTGYDEGRYAHQTADGGFIVTGISGSFGATNNNVYLLKTDSLGNPVWSKTYDAGNAEGGLFVQQTSDKGYIVKGYSNIFTFNNYLIKTDSSGNLVWSKVFDGGSPQIGWSVKQTLDGGYILSGGSSNYGSGNGDAGLIKTDSIGNIIWSKVLDVFYGDAIIFAEQSNDGGYIAVGYNYDSTQSYIYLIKTDSLGFAGCNEINAPTNVTSPATVVNTVTSFVNNVIFMVDNRGFVVKSGGVITDLCSLTINESLEKNSISIFPNPATDVLSISFSGESLNYQLEISNIFGEIVVNNIIYSGITNKINLSAVYSGIYFVKVFDDENSYCKKLIIE